MNIKPLAVCKSNTIKTESTKTQLNNNITLDTSIDNTNTDSTSIDNINTTSTNVSSDAVIEKKVTFNDIYKIIVEVKKTLPKTNNLYRRCMNLKKKLGVSEYTQEQYEQFMTIIDDEKRVLADSFISIDVENTIKAIKHLLEVKSIYDVTDDEHEILYILSTCPSMQRVMIAKQAGTTLDEMNQCM
jgi:hypothetical protein